MVILEIVQESWTTKLCNIDSLSLIQVFAVLFYYFIFTIWIDKVFNWMGNLEWLKVHFAKSILSGVVPLLLGIITLIEVLAGVISAIGVVNIIVGNSNFIAFIGAMLSAMAILLLFFGQRIAKDYAGAGGLVSYFILTLGTLYILMQ